MAAFRVLAVLLAISTLGYCNVEELFTREKCIEELGCFYAGKPFFDLIERPISLLPDDRDVIDTKFYLYTVRSRQDNIIFSNLDHSIGNLMSNGFDPRVKTKIIIAGFMSQFATYWKKPLIEVLLRTEECNVFLVDWHAGDGPLYEQAVANTRVVGAEIALFIQRIQEKTGISFDSIHLIGHSLGAHIAGYVGKRLNKISRITALDPAGPYFTNVDPIVRLDKSDALFVEAIHTNAAPNRFQGFGLTDSIAHLDFWPNGGHLQPGCPNMGSSILTFLSHPTLDYAGLHDLMCNHDRAIDLFLSSIIHNECELVGTVCTSWEDYINNKCQNERKFSMGIHADAYAKYIDNSKSLNIFFNTTESEPFCNH